MRAGVAQQGPAELSSLDLGRHRSHSALLSHRSEPAGEAGIGEPTGGRWERGGAGPGFLEVMVSNRGCQGCSFWVTQLSAPVCVIAVSRVGCSVTERLPLLPNSAGEGWCAFRERCCTVGFALSALCPYMPCTNYSVLKLSLW